MKYIEKTKRSNLAFSGPDMDVRISREQWSWNSGTCTEVTTRFKADNLNIRIRFIAAGRGEYASEQRSPNVPREELARLGLVMAQAAREGLYSNARRNDVLAARSAAQRVQRSASVLNGGDFYPGEHSLLIIHSAI